MSSRLLAWAHAFVDVTCASPSAPFSSPSPPPARILSLPPLVPLPGSLPWHCEEADLLAQRAVGAPCKKFGPDGPLSRDYAESMSRASVVKGERLLRIVSEAMPGEGAAGVQKMKAPGAQGAATRMGGWASEALVGRSGRPGALALLLGVTLDVLVARLGGGGGWGGGAPLGSWSSSRGRGPQDET